MMYKKRIYIIGLFNRFSFVLSFIEHFSRSMDGEGNFNWRFVNEFLYVPAERCISVKKKEYFWSYDATELTIPPVLNLQVWDNDKFSADDFLGKIFFFFLLINILFFKFRCINT